MSREQLAHLTLRIGVAFAFLYPPIKAISDPISWLAYFPKTLTDLPIDSLVLLHGFGVIEAILALWILSGKYIRIPSILATLMLVIIVMTNIPEMDIVFRDISIALMTLALAFWPKADTAN